MTSITNSPILSNSSASPDPPNLAPLSSALPPSSTSPPPSSSQPLRLHLFSIGLWLNLGFAFYALFVSPFLGDLTQKTFFQGQTSLLLAALLGTFLVLDLIATPLRLSSLFDNLRQTHRLSASTNDLGLPENLSPHLLILGFLGRLIVFGLLIALLCEAIGISLETHPTLLWACVGFLLGKEVVFFGLLLWVSHRPWSIKPVWARLSDGFYLAFYSFVYTVGWEAVFLASPTTLAVEDLWMLLPTTFFLLIGFGLIFLPLRLPYLIEESLAERTPKETWLLLASFVLAAFGGLFPAFQKTLQGRTTSLSDALASPSKVRSLYLQRQKLSALPPEIGTFTELRILHLYANRLTSLPPSIGELHRLHTLNLMYNRLASLPPSFGNLGRLRIFEAYQNHLTSLPDAITALPALERLDLSHNRLSSLPPDWSRLSSLRELLLDNNALTSLPSSLCKLPKLRRLEVRNNRLMSLPACLRSKPFLRLEWFGNPGYVLHRLVSLPRKPSE